MTMILFISIIIAYLVHSYAAAQEFINESKKDK